MLFRTSVYSSLLPKVYSYIYSVAICSVRGFGHIFIRYVPVTAEINSFVFAVEEVPVLLTYLALQIPGVYVCESLSAPTCVL